MNKIIRDFEEFFYLLGKNIVGIIGIFYVYNTFIIL